MQSYDNSPETTFIGAELHKGYEPILERYTRAYTNAEQMGKLTFFGPHVRFLPASCGAVEYAVVTGKFHLERTAHGEAKKDDGTSRRLAQRPAGLENRSRPHELDRCIRLL